MKKLREEYQEHLKNINEAQEAFDKNPNTGTATKLSNLKNNLFKDPREIFTPAYIKQRIEELEPTEEQVPKLQIIYGPGLYNHEAVDLKVTLR